MRRLTGVYEGVEHVILEHDPVPESQVGMIECPSDLHDALAKDDGSMPTGFELDAACRTLFGDTFQVREI